MGNPLLARRAGLALSVSVALGLSPAIELSAGELPAYWAVTGVQPDDMLNLRDVPHGDSKKLGAIPYNARGLKHLGCITPDPSFDRWMYMTEAERANAKLEWCRIEYRGQQGWVAARFLKPDSGAR